MSEKNNDQQIELSYLKSGIVGMIGSLIMFIFIMIGIHVTGFAPFELPPSAALLKKIGLPPKPLGLIVHFFYGAFWSIILITLFKDGTNIGKGVLVAVILWLIMMLVHSPLIGWGVFGFGGTNEGKLALEEGPKYMIMTLVLHLIYGLIIGWLNPKWSVSSTSNR